MARIDCEGFVSVGLLSALPPILFLDFRLFLLLFKLLLLSVLFLSFFFDMDNLRMDVSNLEYIYFFGHKQLFRRSLASCLCFSCSWTSYFGTIKNKKAFFCLLHNLPLTFLSFVNEYEHDALSFNKLERFFSPESANFADLRNSYPFGRSFCYYLRSMSLKKSSRRKQ